MENNKYNVVLPWKKELIDKVESNFEIAKALAISKLLSTLSISSFFHGRTTLYLLFSIEMFFSNSFIISL